MNNAQFEALAKLILPALFFVIAWALNQVLNREAAPGGGMRPARPPGGLPPAPLPGDRGGRDLIWQEAAPPLPRREPMAGPDEIIIIGSETRPPRGGPVVPVRRRRPPPTAAPARPEPPRPVAPPPSLAPSAATAEPLPSKVVPRSATLGALRETLMSPTRLRDALMLREILDPPVALRTTRPGRHLRRVPPARDPGTPPR